MNLLLIGYNIPLLPYSLDIKNQYSNNLWFFNEPEWTYRPKFDGNVRGDKDPKILSFVELKSESVDTLGPVLDNNYAGISVMSLDGIFSPVSLYPTPYCSTYNITAYTRENCPYCFGLGTFTNRYISPQNITRQQSPTAIKTSIAKQTIGYKCPFCVPKAKKEKGYKKGTSQSEGTPPFIITSGTDAFTLGPEYVQSQIINKYSLVPVVTYSGEFGCTGFRQAGDTSGHSIEVVAYGQSPPKDGNSLRGFVSTNPYSNIDTIEKPFQKDSNGVAKPTENNQRFFGLRGPMILHSWGYDRDGFPVPNASGEYKVINGTVQTRLDNNGNPVPIFKNQKIQSDGSYSEPYKENQFFKGWAQLPSTWPVGPIDFRWDEDAGVWTVGSNYKMVWVTIEHDLIDSNPVRGWLENDLYLDRPELPDGFRKLVFVKDSAGLYKAPRKAMIFCKYDSQNGFYQPVYNNLLTTSGTINGPTNVTIYQSYSKGGILSQDTIADPMPSYTTTYLNPLSLTYTIGKLGLFTFIKGSWVLQASA